MTQVIRRTRHSWTATLAPVPPSGERQNNVVFDSAPLPPIYVTIRHTQTGSTSRPCTATGTRTENFVKLDMVFEIELTDT